MEGYIRVGLRATWDDGATKTHKKQKQISTTPKHKQNVGSGQGDTHRLGDQTKRRRNDRGRGRGRGWVGWGGGGRRQSLPTSINKQRFRFRPPTRGNLIGERLVAHTSHPPAHPCRWFPPLRRRRFEHMGVEHKLVSCSQQDKIARFP